MHHVGDHVGGSVGDRVGDHVGDHARDPAADQVAGVAGVAGVARDGAGRVDGYVDALLVRYREPHRHYHTATHIMWVLRHLHDMTAARPRAAGVCGSGVPDAGAPEAVPSSELIVAALYHDAVYDPRAGDNEARSAALASADLAELGWPGDRCQHVAQLILATAGHVAGQRLAGDGNGNGNDDNDGDGNDGTDTDGSDDDTAMLLDADLAILGAEPAAYQAYVNGVRAEYAHVGPIEWRAGRAAVLQHFLDRPRLYVTDFMYTTRERRARANMGAELAALAASGG